MLKIKTLEDLVNVTQNAWNKFDDISPDYLNEMGLAVKDAYHTVLWYCGFHDTLESLSQDEEFMNLVNFPGKHPKYYSTLKMIHRCIERALNHQD